MFKHTAIVLALAGALFAQNACPDQVTQVMLGKIEEIASSDNCSGGFTLDWKGISIGGPNAPCPASVVVTPPRDFWRSQPDSGTYVQPTGKVEVTVFTFQCTLSFPIFGSYYCKFMGSKVIALLDTYGMFKCQANADAVKVE